VSYLHYWQSTILFGKVPRSILLINLFRIHKIFNLLPNLIVSNILSKNQPQQNSVKMKFQFFLPKVKWLIFSR
jgi:hypothetical protein